MFSGGCQSRGDNVGVGILGVTGTNVFIDSIAFNEIVDYPIQIDSGNTNTVYIGKNIDFGNFSGQPIQYMSGALTAATVASATALALPLNGDTFTISGTTTIATVTGGWLGREVTLIFSGALTFTSSTGAFNDVYCLGGTNITTAANKAIKIKHNGIQWYQL